MTSSQSFLSVFGADHIRRSAISLATALVLIACGDKASDGTVPDGMAMGSNANGATMDSATGGMSGMDHAGMGAMTGNADQDFLRMMSDHHKGLVVIAQAAKDNATASEGVRADARTLDAAQTAEISAMVTMLDTAYQDSYQPTVSPDNKAMADALAAQSGEAYDRLLYETMVKHHQQAIAMVDDHLSKLTRPTVQAMAAQMKADQSRELSTFRRKAGG